MSDEFDPMDFDKIIARMEAEAGCELPELSDATILDRVRRLLDCDDPPCGADLALCRRLLRELEG